MARRRCSKKRWIRCALSGRRGALHKQLGIAVGKKIPTATLVRAARKPGLVGRRARLALTLRKLRKRRKRR